MNVLFLSKDPLFYVEYATRLEDNEIPFWTAHTTNEFHEMFARVTIDLVFADYNLIDFTKFDVYKHIKGKGNKLVFLFLNDPNKTNNLFVQWEDKITEECPDLWTEELERVLRIVANQSFSNDFDLGPTKVKNLFAQTANEIEKEDVSPLPNLSIADEFPNKKNNKVIFLENENNILANEIRETKESDSEEEKIIKNFLAIKKIYNMSFSEFILLNLFREKKNTLVSLVDMTERLDIPTDEKNIKKVYRYIHNIRVYLEKYEDGMESISRIKKGVYSLVNRV